MRWRPISAGVLSDKGFAPKDTQRCCGPMELPQSTAKVGPDPPWWGVGVHWTGAVLLWGASTTYDLFARKDRRGRGTKLRLGPDQLGGIGMPPPRRRLIFYRYFFKEKSCMNLRQQPWGTVLRLMTRRAAPGTSRKVVSAKRYRAVSRFPMGRLLCLRPSI